MSKPFSYIKGFEMTAKEALIKSLTWRFAVAIPVGFLVTYFLIGYLFQSIVLTVAYNVTGTVFYYLFELVWFNFLGDAFGFDRVTEKDSAGSRDDLKNQTI